MSRHRINAPCRKQSFGVNKYHYLSFVPVGAFVIVLLLPLRFVIRRGNLQVHTIFG